MASANISPFGEAVAVATTTHRSAPSDIVNRNLIQLRGPYGPVYRIASPNPARDITEHDIPIIDLGDIEGTAEQRQKIASQIKRAAEAIGFFYIKNHGIEDITEEAYQQNKNFYAQSEEDRMAVHKKHSKFYSGWSPNRTTRANLKENLGEMLPLTDSSLPRQHPGCERNSDH